MNNTKMIIASIAVALVVGISYLGYSFMNEEDSADGKIEVADQTEASDEVEIVIGNVPTMEEVTEELPLDLPDHAVQNYIHWMPHQKIYAKQKWGKMLITEERIKRLLEVQKDPTS